jgi:TonB family protein
MESPIKKLLKLLVERDPTSAEFRSGVRDAFRPANGAGGSSNIASNESTSAPVDREDLAMWRDVFVEQELPWRRFLQSAALHTAAVVLIWTISASWIRQQKLLDRAVFDRTSLVTYSPQEYLKPLDTGASQSRRVQKGDPIYAKQPIISVPREADNPTQTIVAPPDLKLNHEVAIPNIVATGAVAPAVPLDAARAPLSRVVAPDTQVVAPAPDVEFAPDRVVRAAMKTDVVAPPPELTQSTKGHVTQMNIGPSDVVAPAPQLTLDEQHTLSARSKGHLASGSLQPVAPPPSVAASGGASAGGRLIALGIHPVAPSGPVAVPAGNRRGSFAATPQGKAGASGTPDLAGSKSSAKGLGSHGDATGLNSRNGLPSGLYVGAPNSNDARETASVSSGTTAAHSAARAASPVSDDKITDEDRKVFGGKRIYGRTLNMPNLNSSTGSWVIKFAELDGEHKDGQLLEPVATEKPDPGYPLALMRANVHGVVTLYAVIHADGKVSDIRVINSPDDRLDSYAAKALAGWKFVPAERAGKPVALEAVVEIPFRARGNF